MGYRELVVLVTVAAIAGCAAFDKDNTPYEGFSPEEVQRVVDADAGIYTGYYAGEMTLELNDCNSVTEEVGAKVPFAFTVDHKGDVINVAFEDGKAAAAADLDGDRATVMTKVSEEIRYVFYLTFAGEKVEGSAEVLEKDEADQYGKPCASYGLSLTKGEKPPEVPAS